MKTSISEVYETGIFLLAAVTLFGWFLSQNIAIFRRGLKIRPKKERVRSWRCYFDWCIISALASIYAELLSVC